MALNLLIVDDNLQFLEAARRLLECQGVTVLAVASTGADALRCAEDVRPQVTLVDVDLGEENGVDVARQLMDAAGTEHRPVILISAYPAQDLGDIVEGSPAIGFLSKADLSATAILELLESSGAAY